MSPAKGFRSWFIFIHLERDPFYPIAHLSTLSSQKREEKDSSCLFCGADSLGQIKLLPKHPQDHCHPTPQSALMPRQGGLPMSNPLEADPEE